MRNEGPKLKTWKPGRCCGRSPLSRLRAIGRGKLLPKQVEAPVRPERQPRAEENSQFATQCLRESEGHVQWCSCLPLCMSKCVKRHRVNAIVDPPAKSGHACTTPTPLHRHPVQYPRIGQSQPSFSVSVLCLHVYLLLRIFRLVQLLIQGALPNRIWPCYPLARDCTSLFFLFLANRASLPACRGYSQRLAVGWYGDTHLLLPV